MTYVLRETVGNRYFCKDHNKIIEFNTIKEAENFLAEFTGYSMSKVMSQGLMGNFELLSAIQQLCNSTIIEDKPLECECEFINFKDLKT